MLDRLRFHFRVLRIPVTLMVVFTVLLYFLLRDTSISRDGNFLGLLSQFDGTVTSVLAALVALRLPATGSPERDGRARRRSLHLKWSVLFALLCFSVTTVSVHYHQFGAWGLALNITTIAVVGWMLGGENQEI
ncbi:hypothetical protein ACOALZ_15330 [Nocardiopsis algeriensis]|uniref:hypothetical protein n=1 Tax=Nocardiopsis algeriensis TaxID=1478215 RepID=UPI003B43CDB0